MNLKAIKSKIKWNLLKISPRNLEEVNDFIESMIKRQKKEGKRGVEETVTLKGIWKNIGFEKVSSLEDAVRDVRKESSELLLKRSGKWSA